MLFVLGVQSNNSFEGQGEGSGMHLQNSYLVKIGKNQYHLLSPKTCSAFLITVPKLKPSLFGP